MSKISKIILLYLFLFVTGFDNPCEDKNIINETYISNKTIIHSAIKCKLLLENKSYLQESIKIKSLSSKFGVLNLKRLSKLRDSYEFNEEVLNQMKYKVNCSNINIILILKCLNFVGEDYQEEWSNNNCNSMQNVIVTANEYYEYVSLQYGEVTVNSCSSIEYKFDQINHPKEK